MYKNSFSIILVLLCFVGASYAQTKTVSKNSSVFLNKLKKTSKETNSISASFKQEKKVSFMNNPQLSEGVFYYIKTDKMRWEERKPNHYILLINGESIKVKDGNKEKKMGGAAKMMAQINSLMISLINGDIFDSKGFNSQYFETSKQFIVELTPKNKKLKSIFNTIELAFDKNTLRLKILTFNEKSGDISKMTFFNEKFNQTLTNSLFTNF
jgi:outer membrane lipoprotein-sorting protein